VNAVIQLNQEAHDVNVHGRFFILAIKRKYMKWSEVYVRSVKCSKV